MEKLHAYAATPAASTDSTRTKFQTTNALDFSDAPQNSSAPSDLHDDALVVETCSRAGLRFSELVSRAAAFVLNVRGSSRAPSFCASRQSS